jgi:hypothetical protein
MVLPHSIDSPTRYVITNHKVSHQHDNTYLRKSGLSESGENRYKESGDTYDNMEHEDLDVSPPSVSDIVCECRASDWVSGHMVSRIQTVYLLSIVIANVITR